MDIDFRRGQYRRIYSGAIFGRRINRLSHLAERLFWRLVSATDDFGNHPWDTQLVKHLLLPLVPVAYDEIAPSMEELERNELITTYSVGGEIFAHVVGHKSLQKPPSGRRARRCPRGPHEHLDELDTETNPSLAGVPLEPDLASDAGGACSTQPVETDGNQMKPTETCWHHNHNQNQTSSSSNITSAAAASQAQPGEPAAAGDQDQQDQKALANSDGHDARVVKAINGLLRESVGELAATTASGLISACGLEYDDVISATAGFDPDTAAAAVLRLYHAVQTDRKQVRNPAGFLRHLLKHKSTPPARSEREQKALRLTEVRSASEAARVLACRNLGLPGDFSPFHRFKHPQVSKSDGDAVHRQMNQAAHLARGFNSLRGGKA